MILNLTRLYHFNSGHRLFNTERDDAWNKQVFGKCANPDGHGHNYELAITLRGSVDADTGQLYPVRQLDAQVAELVLDPFDHQNLNVVLDSVATNNRSPEPPTSEVFIKAIWDRLEQGLEPAAKAKLWQLKLWETPRNSFEYPVREEST